METLMTIGILVSFVYAAALVSILTFDVLTGRINRIQGIAHKNNRIAAPLSTQNET